MDDFDQELLKIIRDEHPQTLDEAVRLVSLKFPESKEAIMDRVLRLDHDLIGVNNRNLNTFETSLATSERLKKMLPGEQLLVTESGIKTVSDVKRMQDSGINTFLVGEAFMREEDPGQALKRMFF